MPLSSIIMNKYEIRVCSNAYLILDNNITVLGPEIDELRRGRMTKIKKLNRIVRFYEKILESKITYKEVIDFYQKLTNSIIDESLISELYNIYDKKDLKKALMCIYNNYNSSTKVLLISFIYNFISYELDKKIYIFRNNYFRQFVYINDDNCSKIEKQIHQDSLYYQRTKKVFNVEKIKQIVTSIVSDSSFAFIRKIYIFGSYAKGTNDKYSDVDLLLVVDNELDTIVIAPILKEILHLNYDMDTDVVPAVVGSLDDFDTSVIKHGILIYDRSYR